MGGDELMYVVIRPASWFWMRGIIKGGELNFYRNYRGSWIGGGQVPDLERFLGGLPDSPSLGSSVLSGGSGASRCLPCHVFPHDP